MNIRSLTISAPDDTSFAITLDESELRRRTGFANLQSTNESNSTRTPNVIYIELPVKGNWQKDMTLRHRFAVSLWRRGKRHDVVMDEVPVLVSVAQPPILSSPLGPGAWAAVYNPSWERGHRRVIHAIDGHPIIPGRFAIDFVKLDEDGRYHRHGEDTISNWYSYNEPVLAVADATVVSTRRDVKESLTISGHPGYDWKEGAGNFVALKIAGNNYVFYEHLKPGSIKVNTGDSVKRGDIIAAVGFTGQSTGPHLHLHVSESNSPIAGEGIPFVFDRFTVLGRYDEFEDFGKKRWKKTSGYAGRQIKNERPGSNTVIEF